MAFLRVLCFSGLMALSGCGPSPTEAPTPESPPPPSEAAATRPASAEGFQVPVEYDTLDNGLKVVISRDTTAPVVTVAVYYHIGFRIEPRDRTGFAHLFEHMMFQGSENLGKMEFVQLIQGLGGSLNGSTRYDFTNYYQTVPAHRLETVLWAEADRMRGLAVTQENLVNQQGVVKNEVKVNVLNQPYGGFPWLDLPQAANENWYNAHNFYGDLGDLDAATLEDVRDFFHTYYAPNNAAIAIVGDVDPAEALTLAKQYFGDIDRAELPAPADISEPRQEQEKNASRIDPLAPRPGIAWAYHAPARGTPEHDAMVLLDLILTDGEDSLLYQKLVKEKGFAGSVTGGINFPLGNAHNYQGPMLWTASLIHDADTSPEDVIGALDEVISGLRTETVSPEVLERAVTKFRSGFYDTLGRGTGRADLLACFALFDDDPDRINRIEAGIREVTPELMLATARQYLRPTNRTVFRLEAGAAPAANEEG
jgi:predicted Zn-dependent peptidase